MRLAVERPDKGTAINAFWIEPCPAVTEPRAAKSGESLKQQLRDLGKVEEAYQEVAKRLGILPEAGVRDLKGPELMQ